MRSHVTGRVTLWPSRIVNDSVYRDPRCARHRASTSLVPLPVSGETLNPLSNPSFFTVKIQISTLIHRSRERFIADRFYRRLIKRPSSEVCHFNEDSEPVVARLSSSASFTFDTFPRGSYPPIIVVVLIKKSRLKVYSLFRKDYVIFFILFLLLYEREEEE